MSVAAHQHKEKNEKMGKREAGEEKNSRPVLKRPHAALLRSFRRQYSKKMVCVRRVSGVTGASGRRTVILTPPKQGRGWHHHVEAAVDWCRLGEFVGINVMFTPPPPWHEGAA